MRFSPVGLALKDSFNVSTSGPNDVTINLTISPGFIREGDTSVLSCDAFPKPPWAVGLFNWTIGGKSVHGDKRANISDRFDRTGDMHSSLLILTFSSWKDNGTSNNLHKNILF